MFYVELRLLGNICILVPSNTLKRPLKNLRITASTVITPRTGIPRAHYFLLYSFNFNILASYCALYRAYSKNPVHLL